MGNKKKKDLCKIKEKTELIRNYASVWRVYLCPVTIKRCLPFKPFCYIIFPSNQILYKVKYLYIEKQFNKLHVGVIS